MKREEAKKLILETYEDVYCHNCSHEDDWDYCEECNRKSMYWSPSEKSVDGILDEIYGGDSE